MTNDQVQQFLDDTEAVEGWFWPGVGEGLYDYFARPARAFAPIIIAAARCGNGC